MAHRLQAALLDLLIDGTLNGGDKVLVAYVHRVDAIQDTRSLRTKPPSIPGQCFDQSHQPTN
jgi:hypothetical protein